MTSSDATTSGTATQSPTSGGSHIITGGHDHELPDAVIHACSRLWTTCLLLLLDVSVLSVL